MAVSHFFSNFVAEKRRSSNYEINRIINPEKHKNYEQNSKDYPSGHQLHHRRHPWRSWRGHTHVRTMENKGFKISQYSCAVLLIVSSIALVAYQVIKIDDVAAGLLYYVAQSFLLAGSIFGLDQYVRLIIRSKNLEGQGGRKQIIGNPS